jgi:hypothetical protein
MTWIRSLPCAARGLGLCQGTVEADHAGRRGLGQKADDRTCIPLCQWHHAQRGSFHGPFRQWDQAEMRSWLADMVARYQKLYEMACPR